MDGKAQSAGRAQPPVWQALISAALVYGFTFWLDRILPIPTGFLHSAIVVAPMAIVAGATSLYYRGRIGPWQSWVMFLYFTVRLFRPPVHTVWYGVFDVGGFFLMTWTLLTRSTWQKTT